MIAAGEGRPLRFVLMLMIGWIGARLTFLILPGLLASTPPEIAVARAAAVVPPAGLPRPSSRAATLPPRIGMPRSTWVAPGHDRRIANDAILTRALAAVEVPRPPGASDTRQTAGASPPEPGPVQSADFHSALPILARSGPDQRRFTGSLWMLARGGGTPAIAGAGRLGGGQAGGRLRYRIAEPGIDAAFGIAVPLSGPGREAMIALEWSPLRAPIRLVAEQRVSLDGKIAGGPGLGLVAGINPTPLAAGFQVEGYGQAGAVFRNRTEPYLDGSARITRSVPLAGRARIDLGGAVWAAAQRNVERVDIGPSVSLVLPVQGQSVRLSLDWRERVVGQAAPGSGIAVSLGADF